MSSSTSSNNMNIGLGSYKTTYEYDDVVNMEKNNNISTGIISPSAIGLRLGNTTKLDYGDSSSNSFPHNNITCKINSSSSSTHPTKRSRASYQNMQNPCCQVEGCNLDLRSAKDYHRRHRICESHSKSPKVVVAGMERRFCQQCSRFHDLSEFDDKKRSCRRRLSDHNARRRRVQPDSMQLNSAGLSSALYDHRANNMLLNGLPISLSNSTWENGGSSARDSLIRPSLCFSGDHIHNPISSLQTTSTFPRVLGQCLHAPTSNNSTIVPDLLSANSLLSSNSWSFNEGKIGNSMEGLVHGNYITNPAGSDYNNIILNPDEQGPHVSFLHEYQLLSKTPENNYF